MITPETSVRSLVSIFAPVEALASVQVFDGFGNPINATVDGQTVVFDAADFAVDREFILQFDNPFDEQYMFDIGYEVWGDSLSVSGGATRVCGDAEILGTEVDVRSCGFNGSEIVTMTFDFVRDHQTTFQLEDTETMSMEEITAGDFTFTFISMVR